MQRTLIAAVAVVSIAVPCLANPNVVGVVPTKLIVVDKLVAAEKAKVVYVSKDKASGITKGAATDANAISATLVVLYNSASGAFVLPAGESTGTAGWLVNNDKVAKYVNKEAPGGDTEAKVAVIKPGKLLKLVGKGLGDTDVDVDGLGPPIGAVTTAYGVVNGDTLTRHCSTFPEGTCTHKLIAGGTGAKLVCKGGSADPACTANPCLVDLGDGTILDTCTSLQWEKKTGTETTSVVCRFTPCPDPHDVNNRYQWSIDGTDPTGGAFTDFLVKLNDACSNDPTVSCDDNADCTGVGGPCGFAGHRDWRLPTIGSAGITPTGDATELETIVEPAAPGCGSGSACIDPIFGVTAVSELGGAYVSATTSPFSDTNVLTWWFTGTVGPGVSGKTGSLFVRAVRSGSP